MIRYTYISKDRLVRLLSTLFGQTITPEEKKVTLVRDFGIPVSEELGRSVNNMCDYSAHVENRGFKKGMQQGIQQGIKQGAQQKEYGNIRNLMQNLNWISTQAMDALGIPEAERAKYLEMLKQ